MLYIESGYNLLRAGGYIFVVQKGVYFMKRNSDKPVSPLKRILAAIVCLIALLMLYYSQNKTLDITEYQYKSEQIPEGFDKFCIVQISDLHYASFGTDNKRLIDEISSCDPDIIVITGDIVDKQFTNIPRSVSFVTQACKIAPVYYVTGNHETELSDEDCAELMNGLENAGAAILEDEVIELERMGDHISLIGLKDESLQGGMLHMLTDGMDPSQFSLLLAHEPQFLDLYSESPVDLVLSGHEHGGLIRLPFIGGLISHQGFPPKYIEGMHKNGDTTMIISRGIGNSSLLLRVNCQPEIVCIELQKASPAELPDGEHQ